MNLLKLLCIVKPVFIIAAVFFCFVCCNNDTERLLLDLDQTEMTLDASGGETSIKLSANDTWRADNIPEWVSLSHISGNGFEEITVTIERNKKYEAREAKILFSSRDLTVALTVVQAAKELIWTSMRFGFTSDVDFTFGENSIERICNFKTRRLFVNPEVNSQLFVGGLINRKLKANTEMEMYSGYTYRPITVSTEGLVIFNDVMPSLETQETMVKETLDKTPNLSASFFSDGIGVSFGSYRELHLFGTGNMGVKLDEVISGKPYTEQEMVKETGIIYSFVHNHLTLMMDMQQFIVEEEIKKEDFPEGSISYISSLSYGRVGLLIIETDNDEKDVKPVVNKIIRSNSGNLTKEQNEILNELNAYHIYYDKTRTLQKVSGKAEEVIKSYANQITEDLQNIYPLVITVSDYFKPGDAEMTYSIVLP